ncbi:MAG: hypothetical protein NVSMB55_21830 [Mycobacteriales bacterium]
MVTDLDITDDPTMPCLHCNRYTCRCDETPAPTAVTRTSVAARDWTPWMTAAAASA